MARGGQQGDPHDWVTRAADDAIRHAAGEDRVITCSSGVSPSGPVHLGNLREFLTVHFVADELRRRGVPVRHLHVWDDYDRFRKVPAGVDPSWAEHIGRPLSAVPDPWECHPSWAEHFKAPLRAALHELGVDMDEISQTERYTSGVYRDQVLHAVRHRDDIDQVLAKYRTKERVPESDQEAEELADSVADDEDVDTEATAGLERFPFKPYCRECGRDTTHITAYDDETTDLSYTCQSCGVHRRHQPRHPERGKLVWKVDWPMRWAYEMVDFEPAGMDHATPGSSFTVGHELVETVFGMPRPAWFGYGFVGFAGHAEDVVLEGRRADRGGRAAGDGAGDPALALRTPPSAADVQHRLRPRDRPAVRRVGRAGPQGRRPGEAGRRSARLGARLRDHDRRRAAGAARRRAVPHPLVGGRRDRRVRRADQPGHLARGTQALVGDRPRAAALARDGLDERVRAAGGPDHRPVRARRGATRRRCPSASGSWLSLLLDGLAQMPDELDLDPVTALVYGVPKLAHGLPVDADPTDEVKADQKEFFRLLYNLLVDKDRGPRLPTLVVALGSDRVRRLLTQP